MLLVVTSTLRQRLLVDLMQQQKIGQKRVSLQQHGMVTMLFMTAQVFWLLAVSNRRKQRSARFRTIK